MLHSNRAFFIRLLIYCFNISYKICFILSPSVDFPKLHLAQYKNTVKNNIKCCRLGAKFCVGCRWIQIAFKGYYWLVQMKMTELQEPMPAPGIEKPGADQQKLGSATAQKPSFKFHLIFHFFQQCMCYLKTCTLCETKYFVSQLSNV